jgi:hypothetical protein
MTALLNFLIPLSAILIYILVGVLFCLSQRSAIRVVQPKNRQLSPDMVWLQLIPIFGAVCNIIVTILIAGSFRAELASVRDDSILGIDADTIDQLGKRPTLGLGITYFALYVIWYASFIVAGNVYPELGFILSYSISLALFLIATIFLIIYWIKLNRMKRKIAGLTN